MPESSVKAAPGLRIATLDDDAIVFNPFSWETHLLNPAASLVLDAVSAGPLTRSQIAEILGEVLEESERGRAGEHAARLVDSLLALRLLVEARGDADAGR